MHRGFPLNISAIKAYGIEKWFNEEPLWPVADFEFDGVFNELTGFYADSITFFEEDIKNSILVLNKLFLGDLLLYLHAILVANKLLNSKRNPLGADQLLYYPYILDGKEFSSYYDLYKLKKNSLFSRFKSKASQIKRDFDSKSEFLSIHQAKKQFASALGNPNFNTINPELIKFKEKKSQSIDLFVKNLLQKVCDILKKFGIESVDNRLLIPIEELVRKSCLTVNSYIHNAEKFLSKYKQDKILVNSLADVKSKCCAIAARKLGKEVFGGMHGNITFITKKTPAVYSDLPVVDNYILSSFKSGVHLRDSYNLMKNKFYSFPQISIFKSTYYQSIYNENQMKVANKSIKKVMILEPPLNDYRFNVHRGHFWYNRLFESIRLAKILRENGFETIIKRHPDTKNESTSLYDAFFDHQNFDRFEDVWSIADAFIFMSVTTTTFGFACTTNRPILLFSPIIDDCFSEPASLLLKRCRVVNANYNENDRLEFSEEEFIQLLKCSVEAVDSEYVTAYLIDQIN